MKRFLMALLVMAMVVTASNAFAGGFGRRLGHGFAYGFGGALGVSAAGAITEVFFGGGRYGGGGYGGGYYSSQPVYYQPAPAPVCGWVWVSGQQPMFDAYGRYMGTTQPIWVCQ